MNVARSYPKELHRRKSRNKHENEPPDGSCPEAKAAQGALRRSIVFVEEGCGGVRKDISSEALLHVQPGNLCFLRGWEHFESILSMVRNARLHVCTALILSPIIASLESHRVRRAAPHAPPVHAPHLAGHRAQTPQEA